MNTETVEKTSEKSPAKDHQLLIVNRKIITVTDASKVESATPNNIVLIVDGSALNISGSNLFVQKLDIANGLVEIEGEIDGLKYQKKVAKGNFFKRLFK